MPLQKNTRFDTSLEALTPEGVKFLFIPAGLPVRTLAYSIDQFIQMMIFITISMLFVYLRHSIGYWVFLLLIFCIDWFYHVICELAFRGQSPGKRLTGIRVIRSDGAPVDPASSFIRNLLRFADTLFGLYSIALISITASTGFRRVGDWAGGTLVVYSQTATKFPRNLSNFLAKYDPINPPYTLSHDEKQTILSFARRYPLLGESRANEIAGTYAPRLRSSQITKDGNQTGITDSVYLLGIARFLSGETLPFSKKVLIPEKPA
jgi:uncharacterized RDD family membrane protein YckC